MPIRHIRTVLTTSRDANIKIRRFINELALVLPYSIRLNRGKMNLEQLIKKVSKLGASYLVIITKHKGNPGMLEVYDLVLGSLKYRYIIKGIALLSDMKMKRPSNKLSSGCIGKIECEELKNLIFDLGFTSISDCQGYIYAIRDKEQGICKVYVEDAYSNLISPIIKLKI